MAILRHYRDGIKRRGRAQHRANVMRISHLIKQQDRAIIVGIIGQYIAKPDVIERINLVAARFRAYAAADPDRFAVVDADGTIPEVHGQVMAALARKLGAP